MELEGKEGALEYFSLVGTQNLVNKGALEYFGRLVEFEGKEGALEYFSQVGT